MLEATKRANEALGEDTRWMERLVGFGADGASVNMGHRGGGLCSAERGAWGPYRCVSLHASQVAYIKIIIILLLFYHSCLCTDLIFDIQ